MTRHHIPLEPTGFADPAGFGAVSAQAVAAALGASADVALVVDADGAVADVAVSSRTLASAGAAAWRGRRWNETVTVESRIKIDQMSAAVAAGEAPPPRQVNQSLANGEIAIRWLAMPLGDGRLIALGEDLSALAAGQQRLLQAQQALERDYVRLREAEARFRLLFDAVDTAVLIVDAGTRRLRTANLAAARLAGATPSALEGRPLGDLVARADRERLTAYLGAAEVRAGPPPLDLTLDDGPAARLEATPFRQDRARLLLVQLTPAGSSAPDVDGEAFAALASAIPDGTVIVDAALQVTSANAAFVDLAEAGTVERVRGRSLGDWLGRPAVDLPLIANQLADYGVVRNISSILRGDTGGREEVELSAVALGPGDTAPFGFVIRPVGRRLRTVPDPGRDLPRSVEQLTELVGRMPMKDIVRESTDLIERLCIEAALAHTGDNRASAAEILGISRQSLYSKMHRHGLGELGERSGS